MNDTQNGQLTLYVESHLTRVLAGLVASDARVVAGVVRLYGVDDQRMDAVLVHNDLVELVVVDLCAVTEPQQLRDGTARDDAVEACHLALLGVAVDRDLAELWPEVFLRDAAVVARTSSGPGGTGKGSGKR